MLTLSSKYGTYFNRIICSSLQLSLLDNTLPVNCVFILMEAKINANDRGTGMASYQVKTSNKRWLVIFIGVSITTMSVFTAICFGPINNIMTAYFKISYAISDWMTVSTYSLSILCCAIYAWLAYIEVLNLKVVLLLASTTLLIDIVFILISFSNSKLFVLVVIGQFIGGVARSFINLLFYAIGSIWFPENETALATGLALMGKSLGITLSELVPENILKIPTYHNTSENIANQQWNSSEDWYSVDKQRIDIMFLTMVGILILIIVCTVTSVTNLPEHPPSHSQAIKRSNPHKPNFSFKNFFKEVKDLHQDSTYVLIQLSIGFTLEEFLLLTIAMQQLVNDILPQSNVHLNSSVASGLMLVCRAIGITIMGAVGGKIIDRYKQYRLQMLLGIVLSFVSCLGVFLSWIYATFVGLCLCMFLKGVFVTIYGLAAYDAMIQHTYPKNVIFIASCSNVLQFGFAVIIAELGRLFFVKTGALGVMIFYVFVQFLGVLCSLFIKPDLKRLKQEHLANVHKSVTERTPFITRE